MIRGTTPLFEFTLPFDTSMLAEAWVTLSQLGQEKVTKTLAECTTAGEVLSVRLTQEETLKFDASIETEIQLRVRTAMGEALASDIIKISTGRILKGGVI